jgi:hypothetical protein
MLRPPTSLNQVKSTKTIAIGGVKLINEEVHHDHMEVRDAVEGKEHSYIDDGEKICCPVCGITWMTLDESGVIFDSCEHLRFCYHPDWDDFQFSNEWDADGFLELVENARKKDDEKDVLDILNEIQHPDIDKGLLYIWNEDPLSRPWMVWGYKKR